MRCGGTLPDAIELRRDANGEAVAQPKRVTDDRSTPIGAQVMPPSPSAMTRTAIDRHEACSLRVFTDRIPPWRGLPRVGLAAPA
jgi:hypothetical protein